MAWHDGLGDRLRWFIQWSHKLNAYGWHCTSCRARALGIKEGREKVKSRKGKPLEYGQTIYRHDFDSLEHVTEKGEFKNPLVHLPDCKWLKEYLAKIPVETDRIM